MSEITLAATGEIIDPSALATDELAGRLDEVRELRRALGEAERALQDEALARMDRRGAWTAEVGDWRLEASSPEAAVDYDPDKLKEALGQLVADGLVDQDAAGEVFRASTVERVMRGQIGRLSKLGGEVAERLAAARLPASKPRRVRLTPRPQRRIVKSRTPAPKEEAA